MGGNIVYWYGNLCTCVGIVLCCLSSLVVSMMSFPHGVWPCFQRGAVSKALPHLLIPYWAAKKFKIGKHLFLQFETHELQGGDGVPLVGTSVNAWLLPFFPSLPFPSLFFPRPLKLPSGLTWDTRAALGCQASFPCPHPELTWWSHLGRDGVEVGKADCFIPYHCREPLSQWLQWMWPRSLREDFRHLGDYYMETPEMSSKMCGHMNLQNKKINKNIKERIGSLQKEMGNGHHLYTSWRINENMEEQIILLTSVREQRNCSKENIKIKPCEKSKENV